MSGERSGDSGTGQAPEQQARPAARSVKVEVIRPPNKLKQKVTGTPELDRQTLAKIEQRVARLRADYPSWAIKDIEKAEQAIASLHPDNGDASDTLREIYQVSHEIRGQGGSFGYDLMTRFGHSLCRLTDDRDSVNQQAIDVLRAHVNAMRAVITNKVTDEADPVGREIAENLEKLVERFEG